MSLPAVLKTTLATIPNAVPYLAADAAGRKRWRQELGRYPGVQGGHRLAGQSELSLPERRFAEERRSHSARAVRAPGPLAAVRLFSLQKGYGTEQLAACSSWGIVELGDRLDDSRHGRRHDESRPDRLAGYLPAHLAGAWGGPVWTALPFAGCWRWLLATEDTPWYPTMRLFRQRRAGEWGDVFERMAQELA